MSMVRWATLSALALALGVRPGTAFAFVPEEEHTPYEIPLPYQGLDLVRGTGVASIADPTVRTAIEARIGGQWSVHSWNRRSQSPHYVLGSGADVASPFTSPADAEAAALSVLRLNAEALRLRSEELRLDTVVEGVGKAAAHFQQTYEGIDVIGGRAHATFMNTGRVFVMGSDFFEIGGLDVTPAISQAIAERIAIDDLPFESRSISAKPGEESELRILPYPTSAETFDPRLVWHVVVETGDRSGLFHTYVDATSGEILWRYNGVHYAFYEGSVDAMVQDETWCNGEAIQPLRHAEVNVEGLGTTVSNANGNWSISGPDVGFREASTTFRGPFVDVNRASGGPDAFIIDFALPGQPVALSWSDANSRQDERDVFDAVVDIHEFFQTIDPGFGFANSRVIANVGVAGECNAFWNGSSINFYNQSASGCSGTGCANTGEIQSVVHHEYGHGVQDHAVGGSGNEGIHEGNADVMANFMTDDSVIGRGFCLVNCGGGIRNSSNTLQYPEDLTGGVHADGRIIAGVVWDVRQNLEAALGTVAGKEHAAILWHWGRRLEQPENQPDQCLSMFIADDDNGNVLDGTPHFDAICAGVMQHDLDGDAFDCPEAGSIWVDFDYVGTEQGTQARPYNSLFQAHGAAPSGYVMKIRDGSSPEVGTLSKPGVLRAIGGPVRVGGP